MYQYKDSRKAFKREKKYELQQIIREMTRQEQIEKQQIQENRKKKNCVNISNNKLVRQHSILEMDDILSKKLRIF